MGTCFSSGAGSAAHPHPQPHPHGPRSSGRKRRSSSFPGEECSTLSTPNKSSLKIMETHTSLPPPSKNVEDLRESPGYHNVDIFTYHEMRLATKHFRPDLIVGEGGFGVVYRGVLDEDVRRGYDATQVAIKELNRQGFQGDREWLAEVNYLGQFSHPNLVKLIGYCCEDDHRLLVYEYMAGGSLEKHLFRRVGCPLTWSRRMKIALDAAKGLAFLHGAERSIIYRDFKTSNVLLDADHNNMVSEATMDDVHQLRQLFERFFDKYECFIEKYEEDQGQLKAQLENLENSHV